MQGHSGRNLIGSTLQVNVVVLSGFFQYICHVGCAINLHSNINSGLMSGAQKFEQQKTSILSADSILSACRSHGQRT